MIPFAFSSWKHLRTSLASFKRFWFKADGLLRFSLLLLHMLFAKVFPFHFVPWPFVWNKKWRDSRCCFSVTVKNSSPLLTVGQMSVNCRPTVSRLLIICQPTVGQLWANCRPTAYRHLADSLSGKITSCRTSVVVMTIFRGGS